MEALYPTGKVIPISTVPLILVNGGYAEDLTTIKFKMRRASDGKVLDWDSVGGPTFLDAVGPFVNILKAMAQFSADFPGEYVYSLDLATITNVVDYDTYFITAIEDDTAQLVANLPQSGQFRIAPELDDAILSRKALYNDQTLQPGDTDNLELYDDDKATPIARWNVKDPSGLAITLDTGSPAIRRRVL